MILDLNEENIFEYAFTKLLDTIFGVPSRPCGPLPASIGRSHLTPDHDLITLESLAQEPSNSQEAPRSTLA